MNYTEPTDPAAESHSEIDAATFVRHALLPYNAGDDYDTIEDMIPDIYGSATISGLTPGTWYYIRETGAPTGYNIDDTSNRYFQAPTTSGTIPTFRKSPTSTGEVITAGQIWKDSPTATPSPTPTTAPTPTPTPTTAPTPTPTPTTTPTPTPTPTPTTAPTPTPTPTTTTVSFNIQKRAGSTTGSLLSGATFTVYEYTSSWALFVTVTSSSG